MELRCFKPYCLSFKPYCSNRFRFQHSKSHSPLREWLFDFGRRSDLRTEDRSDGGGINERER